MTEPTDQHREQARHKRFGPEDYARIQESLDSLDWNITDEQAETVLREFGTSGKEIANQFIDRVLRERQEAIDALSSRDAEIREVLEGLRNEDDDCWCVHFGSGYHTKECERAQALWSKLQGAP